MHALSNDSHSAECSALLEALRQNAVTAVFDILVLHELTYAIPRYRKGSTRSGLASFLTGVIEMPGVVCDKALFIDSLKRWSETPGLGFVDAYLASRAVSEDAPILTKNIRELRSQGATVADPLQQ